MHSTTVGVLPVETYRLILDSVPILCVDLIIKNPDELILLLRRANEPLKGRWWVPGGRVHKGELLEQAVQRIAREETGLQVGLIQPVGIREYHFEESPFGLTGGTHNVAIVFKCSVQDASLVVMDQQHFSWTLSEFLPEDFELQTFGVQ